MVMLTGEDWRLSFKKRQYIVFAAAVAASLAFACYTNHAWEDWFITYRASKNLATGNGLVFTAGQRVHSFTSPLGTLVPALLNLLTGNRSDLLVLWLFRAIGCTLLGVSAALLLRIAEFTKMHLVATIVMVGMFIVDAKIVDFSINGQETALMMVFLIAVLHLFFTPAEHFTIKLGVLWGALMWVRPDSFVYFGALAAGMLLFMPDLHHIGSRAKMARSFAGAACIAAAIYLPWTLWTVYYYGTAVPHTIVAKGLFSTRPLSVFVFNFLTLPVRSLLSSSSFDATFIPAYFLLGGWPHVIIYFGKALALLSAYYWCLPSADRSARAVSFAVFLCHFYLTDISATAAPWYVPNITVLSIVVLGQIVQRLANVVRYARDFTRTAFQTCCFTVLGFSLLLTLLVAYQVRLQQEIIEEGHRKKIGLWLREHAQPGDRVFLECLGYIGFYSQLKMLDFPGMSSPEMVAARRTLQTDDFAPLIHELKPEWLVLRPLEEGRIEEQMPGMLAADYQPVRRFDVSRLLASQAFIPGRPYLEYDQTFLVYRSRRLPG